MKSVKLVQEHRAVRKPSIVVPVVLSVLILGVFFGGAWAYSAVEGPLEAGQALKQVDGTTQGYLEGTILARIDVSGTLQFIGMVLLSLTWGVFAWRRHRYGSLPTAGTNPESAA